MEEEDHQGPEALTCLAFQELGGSCATRTRSLGGFWARWALTVFAQDVWQPCVHPSLVNVSIHAQDIHFIMLWRRAGIH